MTTDSTSGQDWYVPPAQGALQPNPPASTASLPQPQFPAVPLQPSGYVQPSSHGQPGAFDATAGYGMPGWGTPTHAPLATPGSRLGSVLLDCVLAVVTLFIGWMIWSLVVWGRGTTPGKSLLNQRVVDAKTGATATWGHMAVRQFLVGTLLAGSLNLVTLYIWSIVDAFMVFTERHRRLTDRISSTLVVQD